MPRPSPLADHRGHPYAACGDGRSPGLLSDLPDDDLRAPVCRGPRPRGDRGRDAGLLHAPRQPEPRRAGRGRRDARGRGPWPRLRLGHGSAHDRRARPGASRRSRGGTAEHVRRLAEPGPGAAPSPRSRVHPRRAVGRRCLGGRRHAGHAAVPDRVAEQPATRDHRHRGGRRHRARARHRDARGQHVRDSGQPAADRARRRPRLAQRDEVPGRPLGHLGRRRRRAGGPDRDDLEHVTDGRRGARARSTPGS